MRPTRTITPIVYQLLLMLTRRVREAREAKRTLQDSKLRHFAEGAEINARMTYKEAKKLIKS